MITAHLLPKAPFNKGLQVFEALGYHGMYKEKQSPTKQIQEGHDCFFRKLSGFDAPHPDFVGSLFFVGSPRIYFRRGSKKGGTYFKRFSIFWKRKGLNIGKTDFRVSSTQFLYPLRQYVTLSANFVLETCKQK